MRTFIENQLLQIRQGGRAVLSRKMKRALKILPKHALKILPKLPLYFLAFPVVFVIRLIRPWLLVRWGGLMSMRIGHFAANTELYHCEQDAGINVPQKRHVDLFYMAYRPICNQQLAIMWKRVLRVWPAWIMSPISFVNLLIPWGAVHEIGNNTQHDRDVHNLLDRFPPHLEFTPEEERKGLAEMNKLGIPNNASYICLHARDPYYLQEVFPSADFRYHSYRDSNIHNCLLAAEELTRRGYYIIRMGSVVAEKLNSSNPKIIDYAANGQRSDFMDIYLGAKCSFCISSTAGIDTIPMIFRRLSMYVNFVPLGYGRYHQGNIFIPKKHWLKTEHRFMTVREIFNSGAGQFLHTQQFEQGGIELIENTPEEIAALAVEMDERLKGTWQATKEDEELQRRFWEIFPTNAVDPYQGRPLHGEIRARIGAQFLRNNRDWLK